MTDVDYPYMNAYKIKQDDGRRYLGWFEREGTSEPEWTRFWDGMKRVALDRLSGDEIFEVFEDMPFAYEIQVYEPEVKG